MSLFACPGQFSHDSARDGAADPSHEAVDFFSFYYFFRSAALFPLPVSVPQSILVTRMTIALYFFSVCQRMTDEFGFDGGAGAVLPCSTGVIGWRLPVADICDRLVSAGVILVTKKKWGFGERTISSG